MHEQQLSALESAALARIRNSRSPQDLEPVRIEVLGRKGSLAQVSKDMGKLAPEDRARAGKLLNAVKLNLESAFESRQRQFDADALQFRLNAELPIPFDGSGQMEVDLLCADARVTIELDGSQHLDGEEAYRRDRRKDLLLQEHGFFVLRFLAADVGRRLDTVLDTILRTLSHRRRH